MHSGLYIGVVEDSYDYLNAGRCHVRVVGVHTSDKTKLPTQDLPLAQVAQISAGTTRISNQPPPNGSQVLVFFKDRYCQQPVIVGVLPKIPQSQLPVSTSIPGGYNQKTSRTDQSRKFGSDSTQETTLLERAHEAGSDTKSQMQELAQDSNDPITSQINESRGSPTQSQQLNILLQSSKNTNSALQRFALLQRQTYGSSTASDILSGKTSLTQIVQQNNDKWNELYHRCGKINIDNLAQAIADNNPAKVLQLTSQSPTLAASTKQVCDLLGETAKIGGGYGPKILASTGITFQSINEIANLESISLNAKKVIANIESAGVSINNTIDSVGNSVVNTVNKVADGIVSAIDLVESVVEFLLGGPFDDLGVVFGKSSGFLQNLFGNVIQYANNLIDKLLGPIKALYNKVVSFLNQYHFNESDISLITEKLTGFAGQAIASVQNAMISTLDATIRSLMVAGLSFIKVVDNVMKVVESFVSAIQKILQAIAKVKKIFNLGGVADKDDGSTKIITMVKSFTNNVRSMLNQVATVVRTTAEGITQWINKQFSDIIARVLGAIFAPIRAVGSAVSGVLSEIANMIPLASIVLGVVTSFVKSVLGIKSEQPDIGVNPTVVRQLVASGTYNQAALKGIGATTTINKVRGGITSDHLINVGSGCTPCTKSVDACNPNFKGGKRQDPKPLAGKQNVDDDTITDELTNWNYKEIDFSRLFIGDKDASQLNKRTINAIKNLIKQRDSTKLKTKYSISAFVACCLAYSQFVPYYKSYNFPTVTSLRNTFPETFAHCSDDYVEKFVACGDKDSDNYISEEAFWNFALNPSGSGKPIGNIEEEDGWAYAPCGFIEIQGRNAFEKIQASIDSSQKENFQNSQAIVGDDVKCLAASVITFVERTQNLDQSNPNFFENVLKIMPEIQGSIADKARAYHCYISGDMSRQNIIAPKTADEFFIPKSFAAQFYET